MQIGVDGEANEGGEAPCWAHHIDEIVYASVRAEVLAREPVDERERRSVAEFVAHYDRLVSPFDEEASPVHVTGSAVIVSARGVVLHRHRRLGIWIQPGGHIDAGEMPWDAARREAIEETGLPIDAQPTDQALRRPALFHVDVHPGGRGHTHLDLRYRFSCGPVDPAPPPGESQEVAWFALDAAITRTDDGLAGLLSWMRDRGVA